MEADISFERRFFAASNSSRGFQNYFDDCFGERSGVDRLFIIKGGPGTGKSYFMRSVAGYAEARGYTVTYYYCSSDPASLDGVRLWKAAMPCVGIVDGTAPHTCEPTCPGVREELVDLGRFWDDSVLKREQASIRRWGEAKAECYRRAYRFLSAEGEMDHVVDDLTSSAVHTERLCHLAERLLRPLPKGHGFRATPALLRAVGMTGEVSFDTYAYMAAAREGGTVVLLENYYGLAYRVMAALLDLSKAKELELLVSPDPVYPHKVHAVYYPAAGLCVAIKEPRELPAGVVSHADVRTVSLRRYMDAAILRSIRPEVRHAEAMCRALREDACRSLKAAAEHHFHMENVYASAMDFQAKEAFEQAFCRRVLDGEGDRGSI